MILASAALAVAAFLVGFHLTGIIPTASRIVALARSAGSVMADRNLADEDKEKAIQKAALAMLGAAFSIFLRVAVTLLITVLPVYLLSWAGLAPAGEVFAFLARIDVIVGATVIVMGGLWLWSKRPKPDPEAAGQYSRMDRAVHRLAFAAPFVQATAADVEDALFAKDIEGIEQKPPVFITSLPRAGTTVVLNALHQVPGVATHLYRDMPFVMAPLLWSRLSSGFHRESELAERAHGDGIEVGYDSPEAFEEMIWRHFWPGNYHEDRIDLWAGDDKDGEATEFFKRHFRKIVALRSGPGGRYVSKNNGNMARLPLLGEMFPAAAIILPLRDPAEHAASLLRQHVNFIGQHASDPFIGRYMRDIGHYEFGSLHRPIAFDGLAGLVGGLTPDQPDYWLGYWLAAMDHAASRPDTIQVLPETVLQDNPQAVMRALCERLELDPGSTDFAAGIRAVAPRADRAAFDADLLARAEDRYRDLAAKCTLL